MTHVEEYLEEQFIIRDLDIYVPIAVLIPSNYEYNFGHIEIINILDTSQLNIDPLTRFDSLVVIFTGCY